MELEKLLVHVPILLVLGLALGVNALTLNDYFHGDDFVAFTELGAKGPWRYLVDTFTFGDVNFYWRPLGQASYLALYHAFGLDPVAFHATSIAMFLVTIWLLYRFCQNMGLSRFASAAACGLFALTPSHVVSVAWVTNSPRLMAMMLFMASLVVLQRALRERSWRLEVVAWFLFFLGPFCDETAVALAPVPVLYAAVHSGSLVLDRWTVVRAVAYAAVVIVLTPMQFVYTLDDEPRLADYSVGLHVFEQTWALASHLVLPLAEGSPLALSFSAISGWQWAAGALAVLAGVLLMVLGSWRMRFLVAWTGLALSPFTLWNIEWMSPRYLYMAVLPYSICLAWLLSAGIEALRSRPGLQTAAAGLLTVAAVAAAGLGLVATERRNSDWAAATQPFEVLAQGLPQTVPDPAPGSRFVIYYGVWQEFPVWPEVVVQTVYGDLSLDVVSLDRRDVASGVPRREARDIVVYYNDGHFFRVDNP
jgi:hypothetical protein